MVWAQVGSKQVVSNKTFMDFLFISGYLNVKTGLISSKKFVTLTAPQSMSQVQKVYESCFAQDQYAPIQNRSIPFLGSITYSAIKGIPLLIISSTEQQLEPTFYHLSPLKLYDEEQLSKACNFELELVDTRISFAAHSSTEYQNWIHALKSAI